MANSLFDILSNKNFDEPAEIRAIKQYVRDNFDHDVEVVVREKEIVISTLSSALAGTLRLRGPAIKRAAHTDKRLVFRIG